MEPRTGLAGAAEAGGRRVLGEALTAGEGPHVVGGVGCWGIRNGCSTSMENRCSAYDSFNFFTFVYLLVGRDFIGLHRASPQAARRGLAHRRRQGPSGHAAVPGS